MFTASHNPAQYNGIKLCRPGAAPVGQDSGLRAITALITAGIPAVERPLGTVTEQDLLPQYSAYLRGLVALPSCVGKTAAAIAHQLTR
jgi:phosphomannomutase